jgi:hypothetical protein
MLMNGQVNRVIKNKESMRRIIIVRGVENSNKTFNINRLAEWIIKEYEIENTLAKDSSENMLGVLKIENLKIGINSAGDNLHEAKKVEELKDEEGNYPDIIICASRTRGNSHNYFKENFTFGKGWLKIYQNVRQFDLNGDRNDRDDRVFKEIKTRLIGLKK